MAAAGETSKPCKPFLHALVVMEGLIRRRLTFQLSGVCAQGIQRHRGKLGVRQRREPEQPPSKTNLPNQPFTKADLLPLDQAAAPGLIQSRDIIMQRAKPLFVGVRLNSGLLHFRQPFKGLSLPGRKCGPTRPECKPEHQGLNDQPVGA